MINTIAYLILSMLISQPLCANSTPSSINSINNVSLTSKAPLLKKETDQIVNLEELKALLSEQKPKKFSYIKYATISAMALAGFYILSTQNWKLSTAVLGGIYIWMSNRTSKQGNLLFTFLNNHLQSDLESFSALGTFSTVEFPAKARKLIQEKFALERRDGARVREEKVQSNLKSLQTDLQIETSAKIALQNQNPRVFVIDFVEHGNTEEELKKLTYYVSFLTRILTSKDEVVLRLTSPGGSVAAYGLAAAQLMRLRSFTDKLTICVDTIAASGGYMMASVGSKIIAAPFSYIGSIGVVVEFLNFHRMLDKIGADFVTVTAGDNKRSIDPFGQISEENKEKKKQELVEIHKQFKTHILEHRPNLNPDKVGTGAIWLGKSALELGLIDEISTSAAYIESKFHDHDVILIRTKNDPSTNSIGALAAAAWKVLNTGVQAIKGWQSGISQQDFYAKFP